MSDTAATNATSAASSAAPLMELRGVSFRWTPAGPPVLEGVDLALREGDFLGVIGPNGAGKSTLLNLMSGWLRPTGGEVRLEGRPLEHWPRREIARRVAVVPQREEGAFPFTALEVALMGRHPHTAGGFGFEDEEDHRVAREALGAVGLAGFENRALSQLSGGERQMALIARALAQRPRLLLLDEPTSSLDPRHQKRVFSLLERLNREERLTVVVVSHDLNLAALFCREAAPLAGGRLRARGAPESALDPRLLAEIFQVEFAVYRSPEGAMTLGMRK